MKSLIWVSITAVLLWGFYLIQVPDEKVRLYFCDVGQGDATLISSRYFQALIDTGPDSGRLSECISSKMPFWDKRIDLVMISHDQKDHSGSLKWLKENYEIGMIVLTGGYPDSYRYGDLYFDILNASAGETDSPENLNDSSLVVRFRFKDFSALFTGDIGFDQELALIRSGVIEKTSVLKVAHHGSKYSSSDILLSALSPDVAVISVGAKNTYGHPSRDTLIRLDGVGIKVFRTDLEGVIELETDGFFLKHPVK